jgi:hypothetical protein
VSTEKQLGGGAAIVGGGGLIWILHVVGVLFATAGHSLVWWGEQLRSVEYNVPALRSELRQFAEKGDSEKTLKQALCSAVDGYVQEKPGDETAGTFVANEIADRLGYLSPLAVDERVSRFETAIDLAQWDSGTAARYAQACLPF